MNKRISINPNICYGKPVIMNTRVLVSNILADSSDGLSFEDIKKSYSNITNEDIKAAVLCTEYRGSDPIAKTQQTF